MFLTTPITNIKSSEHITKPPIVARYSNLDTASRQPLIPASRVISGQRMQSRTNFIHMRAGSKGDDVMKEYKGEDIEENRNPQASQNKYVK